jgi:hypothetical protein
MRCSWPLSVFVGVVLAGTSWAQSPPSAGQPAPTAPSAGTPAEEKAGPKQTPGKVYNAQNQCVDNGEFNAELKSGRNPVGDTIVIDTNFLPTGQPVSIGVRTPYVDKLRFFAALEGADGTQDILFRQDVVTRRAVASDTLVKKKLVEADQTIVTLTIDSEDAGYWQKADLYLTCGTLGSPARVSKTNIHLSPYWSSLWICAISILLAYVWIAFAIRKGDHTFLSFVRSLNPVKRGGPGILHRAISGVSA